MIPITNLPGGSGGRLPLAKISSLLKDLQAAATPQAGALPTPRILQNMLGQEEEIIELAKDAVDFVAQGHGMTAARGVYDEL